MSQPPPTPDGHIPQAPAPRWGLGDVAAGLVTSAVLPLVVAAALVGWGDRRVSQVTLVALFAAATWSGMAAWVFISSYRKGSKSLGRDFGWSFEGSDLGRGVIFGFVSVVVLGVAISLLAEDVARPDEGLLSVSPEGAAEVLTLGVVVVIGAPIVEELFFRGLFLRAAQRRLGTVSAVIGTSVVFGLVHVPDRTGIGVGLAFLPPFLLGLVLAVLAVRTGRLGSSVVAHMSVNAVAFTGLWLQPALQS